MTPLLPGQTNPAVHFIFILRCYRRLRRRHHWRQFQPWSRIESERRHGTCHPQRPHGYGWQCASQPDLDGERQRHKLSREARNDDRRPLHTSFRTNHRYIRRHRSRQSHKFSSTSSAAIIPRRSKLSEAAPSPRPPHKPGRTHRTRGYRRKRAVQSELGHQRDRNELQREAQHHIRRSVHENLFTNRNELHRYRPHERHRLFLCRLGCQLLRRINPAQASATPVAPTQPPAVPSGLQATAGNAQVALTWTASCGATSYHVKRSTVSGGPYAQMGAPTQQRLPKYRPGQWHHILLRRVGAKFDRRKRQFSAGQRDPVKHGADVTITIDPTKTKAISKCIYGPNFYTGDTGASPLLTFDRDGGNRWTAYNWETNASNAGSDYLYENDDYLTTSTIPAEAVRGFVAADQSLDMASLMTIQLQGLVSADESGPVSVTSPPDLTRFKQVIDKKSTISAVAFTETPISTDANVYMDEFVWSMDQKVPGIFGQVHATRRSSVWTTSRNCGTRRTSKSRDTIRSRRTTTSPRPST